MNVGACSFGGVSQKTVNSDENGFAGVTATTGAQQGQVIIEARTTFTSVVFTLMVTEGLPDPDLKQSTLSATSPVLADGVSGSDIVVSIVDAGGQPIEGIKLKLTAIGSGAVLIQPDSLTNRDGKLFAKLTSTKTGEKFILASVLPQNLYLEQRATVVFERGNPSLELVSGDRQTGVVGQKCPEPLVVLLKNGDNPYVDQLVRFTVTSGGGHFEGQDTLLAKSDRQGVVRVNYVLGTTVGENIVYAAAPIAPDKGITFKIWAKAGNAAKIVKQAGDEQIGRVNAPLPQKLGVQVMDAYDNPVSGASVSFSAIDGGSIVTPQTTQTDSTGLAQATAMCGATVGNYTFKAELPAGPFVLFRASADRSNNAPQVVSYLPVETDIAFSYNERIQFEITQVFDADDDPLQFYWHINEQMVGNQAKLLLFMSQLFGPKNTLRCTISDGQDSTFVVWTLNLDTKVDISSFNAVFVKKIGNVLKWTTAFERDHLGFRVLRSQSKDKDFQIISEQIITPKSDRTYEFIDSDDLQPGTYYYQLESIAGSGHVTQHQPVAVTVQAPEQYALMQNYPNPFNPVTTIAFELPTSVTVRLMIYNQKGQLVRSLLDRDMPAGYHTVVWDAKDQFGIQAPTGIYLYRLTAGDFAQTKKLTLLK